MEISQSKGTCQGTNQFKIDLIVWKSSVACLVSNVSLTFKIDLIVWKFINDSHDSLFLESLK